MTVYNNTKKELALHISKIIPVKIKYGISTGMLLYGNLFYNRRPVELSKEELFYKNLDLKDKIIIEVGAHIGIYTLFFAKQVGNGKILAFEPNPITFYFLRKNLKKNLLSNALTINAGLSNEKGELYFAAKRYNMAKGTFKTDKQELMIEQDIPLIEKKIPVKTIDKIVDDYSLKRVDFVKIDTEGFEPFVIEGMSNTLKNYQPYIYFEIHGLSDEQKQEDLQKVFNFLKKFNYHVSKLANGLPEIDEENISEFSGGGYVAYHEMNSSLQKAISHFKK
jgi:FkbM family methyltransferase